MDTDKQEASDAKECQCCEVCKLISEELSQKNGIVFERNYSPFGDDGLGFAMAALGAALAVKVFSK